MAITVGWKLAVVHWEGLFETIAGGAAPDYLLTWIAVDQLPGWVYSFALGMTCAWAYVRLAQPRPREQLERLALRAAPFALIAFLLLGMLRKMAQDNQTLLETTRLVRTNLMHRKDFTRLKQFQKPPPLDSRQLSLNWSST